MTGARGGVAVSMSAPPPASAPTSSAKRDVVFTFSYVTWDGAQRRGMHFAQDRLVERLLGEERVSRLIVADWYRSAPVKLARTALLRDDRPLPDRPGASRHQPVRLRRRDPVGLAAIERSMRAYDRRLQRAVTRAGLERPAMITMHPLIAGFAPLDWAANVTFYATDDWSAAPEYRAWWPAYDEAYRRIRERGRAVCAVSQPIIDRIAPTGAGIVVPNGIEPAEWDAIDPAPAPWFQSLPCPRILYVGSLDARLDIERVKRTASRFPEGSVVLVGPDRDPAHIAALRGVNNIHVRERVARAEIPALVQGADVCIVPHVRTRFTTAMSPLKVYEYLAAGRPVAAVDLPPLQGVDDRVVLAGDDDDFAAAVATALELGPASDRARRAFVQRHAWSRRHDRVLDFAFGDLSAPTPRAG